MSVLPNPNPGDTFASMGTYISQNASALYDLAEAFVDDLATQADIDYASLANGQETLSYNQWDYDTELASLRANVPAYLSTYDPQLIAVANSLAALDVPAAPTLDLPTAAIPTLDAERPVITLPDLPGTDVGDAPADAPYIVEAALPDAPSITLPAVPTFEELQLPVAPSFSLPTLSSQAPVFDISAPTQEFAFVDAEYTSSLRDPLVAKLLSNLENGGYGIETADEEALWTRARDRAAQAGRQAVDEIMRQAGKFSFGMPQGALYAQLEAARQDMQRQVSEANREIALKRADMYVENRKFTIQEIQKYEETAIALYNAVQERALNMAKATVELGVAVYDAGVRAFAAELDAYKTEAQVFETRVRAELAKAELFRSQIQAEMLRGQFNEQKVSLYQAQLNGITAVSNLYKTRLEAANTLMQVQATKVDIFKARVQAYATRVQAKASEYDMYRAAVQGEVAKLDIYRTDIAAYQAKLTGEETRVRTLAAGNEALIQQYRASAAQFAAQVDALSKQADMLNERDKTFVQGQAVNVSVYRALADAILAGSTARIGAQKMNNEWNIAVLNSRVDRVKTQLQALITSTQFRSDIDKYGSKFYGDGATALLSNLSGMNVKST